MIPINKQINEFLSHLGNHRYAMEAQRTVHIGSVACVVQLVVPVSAALTVNTGQSSNSLSLS